MADLTPTVAAKPTSHAGVLVTWNAADNADQEVAFVDGLEIIARNSGVSSRTVTIYGIADPTGRTQNIVATLTSGQTRRFNNLAANLFRQANGKLKIKGSNAEVLFAVLVDRTA